MLSGSEVHYIPMNHLIYSTMSYLALKVKHTEKAYKMTARNEVLHKRGAERHLPGDIWARG